MSPELSKTLAELAQKLGTSVEHLWPILVGQARLDAIVAVVGCGVGAVAATFICRMAFVRMGKPKQDFMDDHALGWGVVMVLASIATLILALCAMSSISAVFYPEAQVIKNLLSH